MKYSLPLIAIMCGAMISVPTYAKKNHVKKEEATATAAVEIKEITGSYDCVGHSSVNGKAFKGTIDIQKGSDDGIYNTTFVYKDGTRDLGTLSTLDKKNVYVQQWHSENAPVVIGLTRVTMTTDKLDLRYTYVNGSNGEISQGTGVCKVVVANQPTTQNQAE